MTETLEPVDATAPSAPTPVSPREGVGKVALTASIVLFAVSLLLSIVLGVIGAPYVDRSSGIPSFQFRTGDPDPVVSMLGLLSPLHVLLGSLVGGWVIVQSIVAIAANRGRRQGVIALVLAVVAPVVSLVVYLLIMLLPR
ncbi:hypothetical protein [Antiquaquibacter soli]|uniref:DUF4064 domain-containing protein n=1 Tax=Antiquaquibacter soli TaxID=3064523 RepID=A0ABT9BJQ6_9MICO|nr:hypothetical protein [Protaetiibacter sp. WY-16]MDO7881248.1 hypothetical protein [Protaetiibacter sp. WY-16]